MFLYLLTILLVLNAFTQDAVLAQECRDRIPQNVCEQMKKNGKCDDPRMSTITELQCPKTCGKC
ncbi:shTK domain protein [Necator americanus]|uniref:ShTK domain protein n=1 Tax=Necator americanus TaxID=51031 RepID=W2TBE5_NECAM|nr:shTK domain protein [Necator americanus]ETN78919.1 shTK domain protein [Necator americanus]